MLAVYRESALAQLILFCRFKIKRGHIIETYGYIVADHLPSVRIRDVLNLSLEIVRILRDVSSGEGFYMTMPCITRAVLLVILILLAAAQIIKESVNLVYAV